MKFTTSSILSAIALFATLVGTSTVTAAPSLLKGSAASSTNNQEQKEDLNENVNNNNVEVADNDEHRRQLFFGQDKNKFKFVNEPYGLRFGGDIANLELPIVGLGRLILKTGTACSFNGFGNLNSTFIPVSSEDVGGVCGYTFDPTKGQGTFDVVLPSLGPLATSNYVFFMVEGGKKIFFIEKKNGIFVMIAEKQFV